MDPSETFGAGIEKYIREEYPAAFRLFQEAASNGHLEALYFLGLMYRDGDCSAPDEARARAMFQAFLLQLRAAASEGDADAQFRLGKLLQFGELVIKNEKEALSFIMASAEGGNSEAQYHLSRLYAYGWCGLHEDEREASRWLWSSAEQGFPEANYLLGIQAAAHYRTSGLTSSQETARRHLTRAAEAGYDGAQAELDRLENGCVGH